MLNSSNQKQNRIGIFLLKALLLLDIQEHSPHIAESLRMPLQQIPWKKGVTQEGVEQNDHSDTLKMDEVYLRTLFHGYPECLYCLL